MWFIDPSNGGHCVLWCVICHHSDLVQVYGRSYMKISPISTLMPNYLASGGVVMIIVNGITRRGSLCVFAPLSLAPEEQMLQQRSTNKCGTYWMCINVYCWGRKFNFIGLANIHVMGCYHYPITTVTVIMYVVLYYHMMSHDIGSVDRATPEDDEVCCLCWPLKVRHRWRYCKLHICILCTTHFNTKCN